MNKRESGTCVPINLMLYSLESHGCPHGLF